MRHLSRPHGVTLVELLVALPLMALVGGTAIAALAGGLRVWERADVGGTSREAGLIALEQVRRDLQNVRRFTPVPFEGSYDQLSFAHVEGAADDSAAPAEIGRLGYFLDERRSRLCRSFTPYRLMRRVRLTDRCLGVLDGVANVRLSYFGQDTAVGEPAWSQHWDSVTPPIAVKIELTPTEPGGARSPQSTVMYLEASASNERSSRTP